MVLVSSVAQGAARSRIALLRCRAQPWQRRVGEAAVVERCVQAHRAVGGKVQRARREDCEIAGPAARVRLLDLRVAGPESCTAF
eukprot:3765814-Prymnesium_polylepis.1